MKKLFIAAMALATIVSCSKDDAGDTVLTSKQKSVTITIANSALETRATLNGAQTSESLANSGDACVVASDLKVFFANSAGTILKEMKLSGTPEDVDHTKPYQYGVKTDADANTPGSYIFHRVPAEVTQVAVARYETGDLPENKTNWEGQNISALAALASNEEKNVARELSDIVLYDADGLTYSEECTTIDGVVYNLYTADLTIAPAFARVELVKIQCTDLGSDITSDGNSTGYDELTLKTFAWGPANGTNYLYTWPTAQPILYGSYVPDNNKDAFGNTISVTGNNRKNEWTANTAISWNVADQVAAPTEAVPMVLTMGGQAYERFVQNDPTLTITKLYQTQTPGENGTVTLSNPLDKFTKKNIYRFNVIFKESNLDTTDDNICVKVLVTIDTWTVVDVYPEFKNNN